MYCNNYTLFIIEQKEPFSMKGSLVFSLSNINFGLSSV